MPVTIIVNDQFKENIRAFSKQKKKKKKKKKKEIVEDIINRKSHELVVRPVPRSARAARIFLFFIVFFFYCLFLLHRDLIARPQDLKILLSPVRLSLAPLRYQTTTADNFGILKAWQSRIRFVTQTKTLDVYSK